MRCIQKKAVPILLYTALHLPVLNFSTKLLEKTSLLIGQEDETEGQTLLLSTDTLHCTILYFIMYYVLSLYLDGRRRVQGKYQPEGSSKTEC